MFPTGLVAQHGAATPMSLGHAGGAGHSGPSVSPAPRSFAPPSGSLFPNPSGAFRGQTGAAQRYPSGQSGRPGHWPTAGQGHHPDNGKSGVGYRRRYPYAYGVYPFVYGYGSPLAFGLPYGDDQDDASAAQQPDYPQQPDHGEQDYGPQYGPEAQGPQYGPETPGPQGRPEAPGPQLSGNTPPPFRPAYQGEAVAAPVHAQPATTLIFKDGRPPAEVHNYALTASTLFDLDGESRKEIPLALLDVPATVEVNRTAGVDFALPVNR
jgi:hypothetical protein